MMHDNESTILIVDDEHLNLKLLKAHLSSAGYHIWEAASGIEALKLAQEGPDLILLDIMMPEIDGFETCRRLKQGDRTRDIPIIFLSSLTDSKAKVTCFEIGGVDFINKPFEAREVLARVQTHITLKQQELQLREHTKKLEQIIEERTRQLIHADRLSTIGTFSAGIAHEIRNPLTGINTYLYNLEELFDSSDNLDPDGIKMVREIVGQLQIASGKIESVIK
ncbi:MAG: response regulator, partial [Deltaproteobacteria bacterium]|nr:response regulator [Deltaproteobacteria bacterium]